MMLGGGRLASTLALPLTEDNLRPRNLSSKNTPPIQKTHFKQHYFYKRKDKIPRTVIGILANPMQSRGFRSVAYFNARHPTCAHSEVCHLPVINLPHHFSRIDVPSLNLFRLGGHKVIIWSSAHTATHKLLFIFPHLFLVASPSLAPLFGSSFNPAALND
ncbi:hypothetical protein K437DRAFT_28738 [Tilletiaria anomala UBC 951]|uniref:Uncharacterized protein n=1 Tax=Tilletiaria anomala (strain ATCC 24038 / CBS 436.72 / UBC 951) TaxID=1037660 RepID=A0A066V9P0_TILAU|nr:uncharacterized protein K437DRAFT_28738 [Tilletiaria anomala UBC 951]KDN38196.1 hypothetical protein K437DRAFT_28738 [Tilletiaria anomala UBC 951]